MIKIDGLRLNKLDFNLNKRGDLIYFDGPFLSHFYDDEGNDYIMNWVDCDETGNRWLLFKIDYSDLNSYFNQKLSLLKFIKKSRFVYFIDINKELKYKKINLTTSKNIPLNYLPVENSFYEDKYSTEYSSKWKLEINEIFQNVRKNKKNTTDEIVFLEASHLPLQIHFEYFSQSNGFKHLIHKQRKAYINPLIMDGYFIELKNVLISKSPIKHRAMASSKTNINEVMDHLVGSTLNILEKDTTQRNKHVRDFSEWRKKHPQFIARLETKVDKLEW